MTSPQVMGLPWGRELTREDMEAMPDDGHRYELIDAILVVSPSPRFSHQDAVMRLGARLLSACPSGMTVLSAPFDVVVADDTVMQPDLLVAWRESFTERDLPTVPLLAIEVLSPSTRSIDLLVKKERLERAGCGHYWVVDPDEPSVTAWALVDGAYVEQARATGDEVFEVAEPLAVTLRPTELIA